VEGPTCKIKETRGVFNKRTSTDRYGVGSTRDQSDLGRPRPIRWRTSHAHVRATAPAPETAAGSPVLVENGLPATVLHMDSTCTKLRRRRSQACAHMGGLVGRRESGGETAAAEIDAGGRTSRAAAASSEGKDDDPASQFEA
jgi:hypothetical protein